MNASVVELPRSGIAPSTGRLTAADVVAHAMVVQEVMAAVMKPEIHYGKIPGTDKPTLFQPGADKLCMTFRIAPEYVIEDLSTADSVRYRVTCRGVHQLSGTAPGSCVGEASSGEEKYKWRRAVNDKEFDATPGTHRRVKYGKSYETKQVRTEPADVANTVLKMAEKRAKIGMVLAVTAASDMFSQDLEDLDAALRESLTEQDAAPQPQEPAAWPADAFAKQLPRWTKAVAEGLKTADEIVALAASKGALSQEQEKTLRELKRDEKKEPVADATPAEPAAAAADHSDFVAEMDAASKEQQP